MDDKIKKITERQGNLELIKSKGARFMKDIKIQTKKKANGKEVYFIRPYINKKPIYVQFNSYPEAEQFLEILPASTKNPNIKVFFDYYYMFIQSIKVPNTAKSYWYAKKYIGPVSNKPLDRITKEDLVACQAGANKSVWNQLLGIFRGVANIGDDKDFYFLVDKFNRDKSHAYKPNREDVTNPNDILKGVLELDYNSKNINYERARIGFLIICFTGLRIGEFLAMKREDWQAEEIKVSKTVTEEFSLSGTAVRTKSTIQHNTKGKRDRLVPVAPLARKFVDAYYDIVEGNGNSKNFSAHPHRKSISTPLLEIKKDLIKAGIRVDSLSPKTARHIFATIFGRQAKSMDDGMKLQKILGHASFMTTEIYVTSNRASSDDISDKFGDFLKGKKDKVS